MITPTQHKKYNQLRREREHSFTTKQLARFLASIKVPRGEQALVGQVYEYRVVCSTGFISGRGVRHVIPR